MAAACGGLPGVDDLKRQPEATLRLPGSVELFHAESPAVSTIEGTTPAFNADILGVDASAEDVTSFYRRVLSGSGWVEDPVDSSGIRSSTESDVDLWRKGDILVRVAVLIKTDPRVPAHDRASEFETFYQLSLIAKRQVVLASGR